MRSRRAGTGPAIALLAAVVAGCGLAEPSRAPTASLSPEPAPSAAVSEAPSPSDRTTPSPTSSEPPPTAPADCPITIGANGPEELRSGLFGWSSAYGNAELWVGGLWPNGVIVPDPAWVDADGATAIKFGWWRIASGALTITGRRLDGAAPPATGDVPDGYGLTGFQASGVTFPTVGCWEITGRVGSAAVTFVTFVVPPPA